MEKVMQGKGGAASWLSGHPCSLTPHTFPILGKLLTLSNLQFPLLQEGDSDCTCLRGELWRLSKWIWIKYLEWCLAQSKSQIIIFVIIIISTWYCVEGCNGSNMAIAKKALLWTGSPETHVLVPILPPTRWQWPHNLLFLEGVGWLCYFDL